MEIRSIFKMRLLFNIKNREILEVQFLESKRLIGKERLTIGQGLDTMLIRALDKILRKHRMGGLSLRGVCMKVPVRNRVFVEISGEMDPNMLSGMILRSVAKALTI